MLAAVEEIVGVVGRLLSAEQLAALFERFKGVFATSEERRQERALRQNQEDFDEEEAEALEVGWRGPPDPSILDVQDTRMHAAARLSMHAGLGPFQFNPELLV